MSPSAVTAPIALNKIDMIVGILGIMKAGAAYVPYDLADHEDPTEMEYYLCGPPMMVQAIEDMLDNLGVEPEMIAYDKFS